MPVPTADQYDKDEASHGSSFTQPGSTGNIAVDNEGTNVSSGSGGAMNTSGSATEGSEALTREEADRLYEERMEEEYAKRDGGA